MSPSASPAFTVLLVGHGGVPSDFPPQKVARLKHLEGTRQRSGAPATDEERALDRELRSHPRTPENDPYRFGLEAIGRALAPLVAPAPVVLAYNEFCAPSLEEAIETLLGNGVQRILVVSAMLTPGGYHSDIEIPAQLHELRARYPGAQLDYAWPYSLELIADVFARQIRAFAE